LQAKEQSKLAINEYDC